MATHLDLEEQEQIEQIKHFWNRWGALITAALVVILLIVGGRTLYQQWRGHQAAQADMLAQAVELALEQNNAAQADAAFAELRDKYPATVQAWQGALARARAAAASSQFDVAQAALDWLLDAAQRLNVDPERIAVCGQSAGGALAAGLALRLRDEGRPALAFQLLDIPVLDDRALTQSARVYTDTLVWNRRNAELGWKAYLGENAGPVSIYAAPARAEDLRGLPPTFISVTQYDPLRDEGIEYARRLAQANVRTELHLYPGTFHGSSRAAPAAAVSIQQDADLHQALARAFAVRDRK